MILFNFGVATEANDYEIQDTEDQIWIKAEDGSLVLMEDIDYGDN